MIDHEPFLRLIAGRQLGDLDAAEEAELDTHLAACTSCAAEARSIADAAAELAFAAAVRRPPPGMRPAVLAAIHAAATAETVSVPASTGAPAPASGIQPSYTPPAPVRAARSPQPSGGWFAWLHGPRLGLAGAGLLGILVVTSIGIGLRALDLQSQLDAQNRTVAAVQKRLDTEAAAMAVVLDPHHVMASLAAEPLAPAAVAEVVYRPGSHEAYLIADQLPATPAGKVYQLWYADAVGAHPLGTVAFDGAGTLVASFGVDLGGKTAVMVTLEQMGGSTGTPGPQVVFGSLPKA
jgi:hypothetical protein